MFPNKLVTTMSSGGFRDRYSVKFDASDDYINHGDNLDLGDDNFTLGMWVKSDAWADGNTRYLFSKREDSNIFWYLRVKSDGYLHFHSAISDGSGGSTTSVYLEDDTTDLSAYNGQWIHIMVACSRAGNLIFYINGYSIKSKVVGTLSAHDLSNSGNWVVGSYASNYGFNGWISEYYQFTNAMGPDDVLRLYAGGQVIDALNFAQAGNMKLWIRCGDGSEGGEYGANAKLYNMTTKGNWFHAYNGTMTNMLHNDITTDVPLS
tara:strand:+ start:572 stop:1357 length:786 start_codon:yes stop_codon:yes gene_type:complete